MQSIIRAGSSWGGRHREGHGHSHGHGAGKSAIISYFFGEKGTGKLTIEEFLRFQQEQVKCRGIFNISNAHKIFSFKMINKLFLEKMYHKYFPKSVSYRSIIMKVFCCLQYLEPGQDKNCFVDINMPVRHSSVQYFTA